MLYEPRVLNLRGRASNRDLEQDIASVTAPLYGLTAEPPFSPNHSQSVYFLLRHRHIIRSQHWVFLTSNFAIFRQLSPHLVQPRGILNILMRCWEVRMCLLGGGNGLGAAESILAREASSAWQPSHRTNILEMNCSGRIRQRKKEERRTFFFPSRTVAEKVIEWEIWKEGSPFRLSLSRDGCGRKTGKRRMEVCPTHLAQLVATCNSLHPLPPSRHRPPHFSVIPESRFHEGD